MSPEDFPPPWREQAAHVLACSDFVTESFSRDSTLLADLLRRGALEQLRSAGGRACWPA